jgi:hypothetical protein
MPRDGRSFLLFLLPAFFFFFVFLVLCHCLTCLLGKAFSCQPLAFSERSLSSS